MKRKIKFRAFIEKDEEYNEPSKMIYFDLFGIDGGYVFEVQKDGNQGGTIDDFPIMQFTGRKDKNGKEEYEGDIVRFYNTQNDKGQVWLYMHPNSPYPNSWLGIVEFKDGEFVVMGKKYEGLISPTPEAPDNEIIGNIYQNPELL